MMAKKIFWSDPYCTQLLAQVSKVSGAEIQLDATIFFAFSGGQESDHGTIGGLPVIAARKQERGIITLCQMITASTSVSKYSSRLIGCGVIA